MFNFITSHDFARTLSIVLDTYKKNKDLQLKEEKEHHTNWKTRDSLNEHLRNTYMEISGQIDSIIQNDFI